MTLTCRDAACRVTGFSFHLQLRGTPRPYIMEHIFFIILNLYLELFVIVMTVGGENDDKNLPVIYSIDQAMFLGNLT